MSGNYFGYQPPSTGYYHYAGASDDYVSGNQSTGGDYAPTQWDSIDIVKMWHMVQNESDERAIAVAEMWRRTAALLEATRDNLQRHAEALAGKWKSDAGQYFMQRVGAALYSLDEWKKVADDHKSGVEQIGNAIEKAQRDFKPVWERYLAKEKSEHADRSEKGFGDVFDGNWADDPEEVKAQFHEEAKGIVKPLADLYIDVYINKVSRGGKYKGPTNAVVTNPSSVPRGGAPTRPGAPAAPPPPAAPPGRPDLMRRPATPETTPPPPPPPPPPAGVELAGGTAAPPAPPTTPSVATPATPAPSAPGLPGVPGVPGNPASRSGGAPTRPNLPGTSGPRSGGPGSPGQPRRGRAPGRPTLPGSQGSGAPNLPRSAQSRRGAAPGKPTLPGGGSGLPPGARPASSRGKGATGSTPKLPGSMAKRPGVVGPDTGPARPTAPQLSGRGHPGKAGKPGSAGGPTVGGAKPPAGQPPEAQATRPNLTGRGAGAGNRPGVTGPGPSLGGRREGAVPPQPDTSRPGIDADRETWVYDEGNELWTTGSEAVASVETPAEYRPKQQGKAIGQA